MCYNTLIMKGNLKQNGIYLTEHEWNTVKLLLNCGYDIELIPPVHIKGVKTADMSMNGIMWEMKSPQGGGKTTISHTIKHAVAQSVNIIIDLRRCKLDDECAIKELERHFNLSKRIRRMKIITKNEKILDYTK